jgi:hypothetical protein
MAWGIFTIVVLNSHVIDLNLRHSFGRNEITYLNAGHGFMMHFNMIIWMFAKEYIVAKAVQHYNTFAISIHVATADIAQENNT